MALRCFQKDEILNCDGYMTILLSSSRFAVSKVSHIFTKYGIATLSLLSRHSKFLFLRISICLILLTGFLSCSSGLLGPTISPSTKARQLRQEGRWEEAIAEYQIHMTRRLEDPRRPLEENPYFYFILIGDCYLEIAKFEDAQNAYISAYKNGVEPEIIAFRIRKLAKWLEDQERFEEAMDMLAQYRYLDDLVLDYDIDQLHKKSIEKEERKKTETSQGQPL